MARAAVRGGSVFYTEVEMNEKKRKIGERTVAESCGLCTVQSVVESGRGNAPIQGGVRCALCACDGWTCACGVRSDSVYDDMFQQ